MNVLKAAYFLVSVLVLIALTDIIEVFEYVLLKFAKLINSENIERLTLECTTFLYLRIINAYARIIKESEKIL